MRARQKVSCSPNHSTGSSLCSIPPTERSDIDMAATGFTPAVHVEALGRLLRLSPDFELDLVDLDRCPQGLRRAVEHCGVDL